ncbi:MAG: HNH endonuclease [Deltaproteobacteria bacterium]|nr:MAG: HNH endonuclease [Deltaproteobacteria bacterium]
MLNSSVLVLNRSYLPIHITSARRAFTLIYRGTARALGIDHQTFDFERWTALSGENGDTIGTSQGPIRVPRVIVLETFDRIPRRYVRFSRINVFARDAFTCQYCAQRLPRSDLNLDHVVPRSLGGKSTWENVVCCCVDCNRRKGGRTPVQAGLKLLRFPSKPRWTPFANLMMSKARYDEWRPFLHIAETRHAARNLVD